ncbi:MAG: polyprenyl synthetase family protein, partial [Verrucomicrobiota bacterium]|nr:polyprenyl synthetase family protein [Verrucomicrobiota bacterium]
MQELDQFLSAQLAAFEPEIRDFAEYCLGASGKRLRPALVFFSGWRDGGSVSPNLVRAAAVVEMVHLATLVHDDIMDGADVRRGRHTAFRAYGSSAAVLMGDAFFAHALHLAAQFPTVEICAIISECTRRVCAGEIMQTLRRGRTDLTLADYRRIIELKTAELFRVSCQLGGQLAGYGGDYVHAVSSFGIHLGIAYQIYDDLADFFGDERRIGKTLGTDLVGGKLTLPLLALLERLPAPERAALAAEIHGDSPPQPGRWVEQMRAHGIFAAVAEAIQADLSLASAALQPWSEQPATPRLAQLVNLLREQVRNLAGC